MATVINTRDVTLLAASPRLLWSGARGISIVSNTSSFNVTEGVPTPSTISLTATLNGVNGTVNWSVSYGTATVVPSGLTASVAFADMSSSVITIKASVTDGGITYDSYITLNKVVNGSVGTDGERGSKTAYASGSVWSDAVALAAVGGTAVVGDTVTISNGTNFALTKFWNGTAWTPTGQVIDGNLLVTNSVTAAKINSNGLTIRDTSGNIMLGSGSALDWARLTTSGLTGASGITNSTISINSSGTLLGAGGGTVSLSGLGYSGDLAATRNTGLFANLAGEITAANAATYFASNSIDGTYIANLAANKISAGTLSAGVIYAGTINADNITSGTLTGRNIRGGNMGIGTGGSFSSFAFEVTSAGVISVDNMFGKNISIQAISGYGTTAISGESNLASGVGVFGKATSSSGWGGSFQNTSGGTFISMATSTRCANSGSGQGVMQVVDGYLPFTGVHLALMSKEVVLEVGDIVCDSHIEYKKDISNTLSVVKPSTYDKEKAALGVYSGEDIFTNFLDIEEDLWYNLSLAYNLVKVNALGEGQINVCGMNGDIEIGDFITTSSIQGKGMKQDCDNNKNYTVAKAREGVKFNSPTEIKMIACTYLCG